MYIILSQKKEGSEYADELYKVYNFPQKYLTNIHEGDIFIYHQGHKSDDKQRFYYGTGRIGSISASPRGGYDAELVDCKPFDYELPILMPDGISYIEKLGKSTNPAWQWSIRKLTDEAYQYIMDHAGIKPKVIDSSLDENDIPDYGTRDSQNRLVCVRKRDKRVSDAVKAKAAGVCQLCGKVAPFIDDQGQPFLECHHVVWLADGGADSVYNAVALCPNCHRRMHVLKKPEDIENLAAIAKNY